LRSNFYSVNPRYTLTAIAFHWIIALLILCGFGLGLYMVDLKFSPQKLSLYAYHKWIGVSVFALVCLRLLWRITHTPPAPPAGMPQWQKAVSGAVHMMLYALMFFIPLTGWLYSSSTGVPTVPFGVSALQLPDLLERNKETAATLKFVHMTLNYTLAVLVLLHFAAALKHQFIDRDGLIRRMLP
jgi:cytochrome b561